MPINLPTSTMDTTQTKLDQSRLQSDSLVGSITKPIILDDTSDQESSVGVYPSPSGSSIVVTAQTILEQSRYRLNSLVGSITNPIILNDTNNQESSVEVYSPLGRSPRNSSFCLKRKRSISDDCDPIQDKTNAKSRIVGPRGYNSCPNSKRAVQRNYVNQIAIQKLSKDSDVVISGNTNIGYEYEEEIGSVKYEYRIRRSPDTSPYGAAPPSTQTYI